jgi:hypothetical protein
VKISNWAVSFVFWLSLAKRVFIFVYASRVQATMAAAFKPSSVTLKVFCLFLLFFGLLFVQFPLAGSLPGYVDTWLYLALFNDYGNHIEVLFTGEALGHCLYPAGAPYAYLEPSFASAAFFLFFKLLHFDDLWAYYGFLVSIFTLNATAAFVLARQYLKQAVPALFTALAFAASSFALGNIENQNTLTYFPAIICIYHFREYLLHRKSINLLLAMVVGGVQIYFGTYTFIFQSFVLLIIGLVHYRQMFLANAWVKVLLALPLYILLALPYMLLYLLNPELNDFYNPSRGDMSALEALSLNVNDLYRVLPNNLLYGIQHDLPQIFIYNLRSASLGITFYLTALIGILARPAFRWEVGVIALLSFVIALGPSITINGQIVTMPMGWLYQVTDLGAFIRHSARMFFITSLMLGLFAGYGIIAIAARTRVPALLILLLAGGIFILENIPFPFEKYESRQYIVDGNPYTEIVKSDSLVVVLELPSSLNFDNDDLGKPFNQFSREYIYMYWQSKHKQYSLNGAVAFFPPKRLANAKLTEKLPDAEALREVVFANGVNYLVYHIGLELPDEVSTLDLLNNCDYLERVTSTDSYQIFKVMGKN